MAILNMMRDAIKQMDLLGKEVVPNVEIINEIPQEDLQVILDNYTKNEMHKHFESIGSGSYGIVYGYKNYAIKKFKDANDSQNRDIEVLKDISHLDCIPTLFATIDECVVITERVQGVTVRKYCEDRNNNRLGIGVDFFHQWEEALFDVIKEGYSPEDLHESNVMIDEKNIRPVIVDVGFFYKHKQSYDANDKQSMRSNAGYSRANSWTGSVLQSYIKEFEFRKAITKKVLKFNRAIFMVDAEYVEQI